MAHDETSTGSKGDVAALAKDNLRFLRAQNLISRSEEEQFTKLLELTSGKDFDAQALKMVQEACDRLSGKGASPAATAIARATYVSAVAANEIATHHAPRLAAAKKTVGGAIAAGAAGAVSGYIGGGIGGAIAGAVSAVITYLLS